MNTQEFFDLVTRLRAAQKTYFKQRSRENLISAKDLEKQVDAALAEGLDDQTQIQSRKPMQTTMFANDEAEKEDEHE